MQKSTKISKNSVISASEIGQFQYCSVSWYLQKKGYKPDSDFIDKGLKKHQDLGRIIDKTNINVKKSNYLALAGYILLILAIIILFFEVI